MMQPTAYPDLNDVLAAFVGGAQAALAANFVGAYLTGSFALGDADEFSDVDFLVVTHTEVDEQQLSALQALHERIYSRESAWAQHLEGSYAPAGTLRRVDPTRTPLPFLDNGARRLEPDDHCNSALVRWVLREHGVVIAGPDPKTLVDPVSGEELRREAFAYVQEYAAWAAEPDSVGAMSKWKQPYLVLTFCRLLWTIATGTICSKRAAAEWATTALDAEWSALIRRALDDRPDPWRRVHEFADAELVNRTLAFAEYAATNAGRFDPAGERERRGLTVPGSSPPSGAPPA